MACCLLYRHAPAKAPRYYRVEISMNLFSEVSVTREWGEVGRKGTNRIRIYGNLREASQAADRYRDAALGRGYVRARS